MEYIDNLPSMDLMRSEKMVFTQLIIPVETAHRAVSYLGQVGLLQFRDVRSDLSINYLCPSNLFTLSIGIFGTIYHCRIHYSRGGAKD